MNRAGPHSPSGRIECVSCTRAAESVGIIADATAKSRTLRVLQLH